MAKAERLFDFQVVHELQKSGALNQVQAKSTADVACAINETDDFTAMKPYRSFKNTIDYQLANAFLFQYLEKNGMRETLRCINAETLGKLCESQQVSPSEHLGIKDLFELCKMWTPEIPARNHQKLAVSLAKRYEALGKKPKAPKAKSEDDSIAATTTNESGHYGTPLVQSLPSSSDDWFGFDESGTSSPYATLPSRLIPKTPADFN